MRNPQVPQVKYDVIPLTGGMDQITPTMQCRPGVCRDALNVEASLTGGYSRIAGYERFSGQSQPSDATYLAITVSNFTNFEPVGGTISGATSGATATIVAEPDGTNTLILTKVTGTFQVGETLRNHLTNPYCTYAAAGPSFTITPFLNATYLAAAADIYRASIAAVPGSGAVRGVQYYNGLVYAFRDNAGGTAGDVYKSSSSGWVQVPLGFSVAFTAGQAAGIAEGATVTGLTSGATAVVKRVAVRTGTFAANTAAGILVFASVTGTFSAAESLQIGGTTRATATGAQSAITRAPGGRVEMVVDNFGGAAVARIYGADGVNKGFEFDGTVYVPIATGMTTDTPAHVAVHKLSLFFSFGSSVQFSGISTPFVWTPVLGAGEIVLPSSVTVFLPQEGDQSTAAMAIYGDTGLSVLYGTSSADFRLVSYPKTSGAKAYGAQNAPESFAFTDRGIMSLQASVSYGNFDAAALTLNLRPFIQLRRNLVSASGISRERAQYRAFFSDGYGLYMTTVNGKVIGTMPVLFLNPVNCTTEGKAPNSDETSYFGSTNGFVYRMDVGTSFDGASIDAVFLLVPNTSKAPRITKRYRKLAAEVSGSGYAAFDFSYDMSYGSAEATQGESTSFDADLSPSAWDSAGFTWDTFTWDGRSLAPSEIGLEGSSEAIAMRFQSSSALCKTFTINNLVLHYNLRRGLR